MAGHYVRVMFASDDDLTDAPWQAVCDCGSKGPHTMFESRAMEWAEDHAHEHAGSVQAIPEQVGS